MRFNPEPKITDLPPGGRLRLNFENHGKIMIFIGKEGFTGKAVFGLSIIIFWLLLIIAWAFMLFQYGFAWSLIAIPFLGLGAYTLITMIEKMNSHQSVKIDENKVLIQKIQSKKTSYVELPLSSITSVSLVEGTYQTLAGISRKGIFPAFISQGKAFGIGELCSNDEKQFLDKFLKSILE
ncbi:MAG: hypothetical protein K0B15_13355 [Lentimicrobium sp.]|nr:hypothetical protein [Lentimicrobium sp.]